MPKAQLIEAALAKLEAELETMRRSADTTRAGAVHEESRPENDKDTRGLEASYLARGQAERVEELTESVRLLENLVPRKFSSDERVALSALVTVEAAGDTKFFLVVPSGGGIEVETATGEPVLLVTPTAPIVRAMLGKEIGDVFSIRVQGASREYEITDLV